MARANSSIGSSQNEGLYFTRILGHELEELLLPLVGEESLAAGAVDTTVGAEGTEGLLEVEDVDECAAFYLVDIERFQDSDFRIQGTRISRGIREGCHRISYRNSLRNSSAEIWRTSNSSKPFLSRVKIMSASVPLNEKY